MTDDDAAAVLDLTEAEWGAGDRDTGLLRMHHLIATDPGGAWVTTDDDGAVDGATLALLREGLWGLSLLIVRKDRQSSGSGRRLMDAALAYGEDARGGIIMASADPRALRTYWKAGYELRPSLDASDVRTPPPPDPSVREGRWPQDRELVDAVSRHVRGAAHGPDMDAMLEPASRTLLVHDDGAFAVFEESRTVVVAAREEPVARAVIRTALHHSRSIDFLDAAQQWAIDEALGAGMKVVPHGATCVKGDVGPMWPYVPSGAYL